MHRGGAGGRTSASAAGERCVRTTAQTATPGAIFPHDHARSRAYRWNEDGLGGICDDRQILCLALRVLERPRPDPEGADLRAHRPRGQPRRGRQGVLVVPRLDADPLLDALALHVPAGRVPVRADLARRERRRGARARPRVRAARHRHLRRRPLLGHHRRLREGRPRTISCFASAIRNAGPGGRLDRTCCRRCGSATRGRGASTLRSPRSRCTGNGWSRSTPQLGARCLAAVGHARTRCSATTRRTRRGSSALDDSPPYPKDGINDHVVARRGHGEPGPDRHQGRLPLPPRRSPEARRPSSTSASATAIPASATTSSRCWPIGSARPTSSTQSSPPTAAARMKRGSSARRSRGCSGRSSSTTTTCAAGSTAIPTQPPPPGRSG